MRERASYEALPNSSPVSVPGRIQQPRQAARRPHTAAVAGANLCQLFTVGASTIAIGAARNVPGPSSACTDSGEISTAYARLPFRPDGLKVYWLANGTGRRRAIGSLSRGWVGWRLPSAYLANAMCARPYSRDKASWTLWFRGIDESEAFSNCKPVENSLPVTGHLAKRTPIPLAYTRQRGWARNTVWCW